jgi:uncharacterized damage-inducible protein DinB
MSIGQDMLAEFDQEMATTRRLLERVPTEKGEWRPHPKSFPLGHLTQLVATMPGWITRTLKETSIDLAAGEGYRYQSTESLVEQFDRHVKEAHDALATVTDEEMAEEWSLKHGDRVLMSMPRKPVIRQHVNHLIHHRGQLSVYLREVDVPIPSIYGPTADEPWGMSGPPNS